MSPDELKIAARLAGIDPERNPMERQALIGRLLDWVRDAVGAPTDEPEEVERSATVWLAEVAGLEPSPGETPDHLEERVWGRLTEDAAKHLIPVWKVASSMAALGPADALADERKLLDNVARRLLPSESTRAAMRQEWESMCAQPVRHHSELVERLAPELKALSERPDLIKSTLVLTLVVAMADSNFELEEDRLYDRIAAKLGVDKDVAERLKTEVSRAFWDAKERLSPRFTGVEDVRITHEISLRAAHESLERVGGLEELEEEAATGFLAGLHRGMFQDRDFQKGMKAWRKTPLHWPVGLAVGFSLFLRGRMRKGTQRNLLQFLYLAYTRQAAAAVK